MANLFAPVSLLRQAHASMKGRMAQRAAIRRTFDELSALSDAELAELGLHRADIWSVAMSASR